MLPVFSRSCSSSLGILVPIVMQRYDEVPFGVYRPHIWALCHASLVLCCWQVRPDVGIAVVFWARVKHQQVRLMFMCFLFYRSCMVRCGAGMIFTVHSFDTVRRGNASLERLTLTTAGRPSLRHVDTLSDGFYGLICRFWLWCMWLISLMLFGNDFSSSSNMYARTPGISGLASVSSL